ncbi:MAG: glucose 1-dehydrogenase [Chloroflexota bacterium]|nr:glucose 1-dehydrogenase [Chloroflexota bacterium]
MRLEGKVAIITGGARGQGATEARMFAQEGARVVIGDIRDELGMQVEAEIRELGGEAVYLHLDVTSDDDWQRAIETAEQRFGKVDVLVNNAAIVLRKDIEETTGEDWDNIMEINAKGVFLGTKAVIPAMRRAGGGSIINISSISGLVSIGPPAYIATKGAVRLFTKSTAIQYASENIRANSIHPGSVDTDMRREGLGSQTDEEIQARVDNIPLGRVGTTEDISYGALFLASDESSFMTGSELVIDGGYTAK